MGSIPLGATNALIFWLRSLMDRIRDSGSLGGGSIPFGATIKNGVNYMTPFLFLNYEYSKTL